MSKLPKNETDISIIYDKLYKSLEKIMEKDTISPSNIVNIVINLMQFIEEYKMLDGNSKKQAIIDILTKFIEDNLKNIKEHELLLEFIKHILPYLIDVIISIDRKELEINVKEICKSFSCFGCA
jgi:hypothetical protein